MKKGILVVLALLITLLYTYGQAKSDTILIVKNKYILNGKVLKPNQMLDLMKDYPDAYSSMKKAKTNYNVAMTFAITGGFCLGYSLGSAIGGGEPSWALAGVGAGLIIASLPFNKAYNTNAKTAIRLYNSEVRHTGMNDFQLDVGITEHGLGLICRF